MRPTDRPTEHTPAFEDRILSEGKGLTEICRPKTMPHRMTVYKWLREIPEFANAYARAREVRADWFAERINEVAAKSTNETYAADPAEDRRVQVDGVEDGAEALRDGATGGGPWRDGHAVGSDREKLPATEMNCCVTGLAFGELLLHRDATNRRWSRKWARMK